jgi:hypothetical protein
MKDFIINFAFQNYNERYDWWHPNTVPLDFIVDGKLEAPCTHDFQWFDINCGILDQEKIKDIFSYPVRKNDLLFCYRNIRYFLLSELSNKKYIFPIIISCPTYFIKNKFGFDLISDAVIDDVKNNKAKIVLIFPFEGSMGQDGAFENDFKILDSWCRKRGLGKNNVFVIHGNASKNKILSKYNFTYVYVNSFTQWIRTKLSDPIDYKPIDCKNLILSYNRRWDWHRLVFVCELVKSNLLDRSLISFFGKDLYSKKPNRELIAERTDLLEQAAYLDKIIPISLDVDVSQNNPVDDINQQHHANTFLSVVTETLWRPGTVFFSEKTFKPILAGQPFIILGSQGMLSALRSQGYLTFGDWWDESYDTETDLNTRLVKIMIVLNNLAALPVDRLLEIRREMLPTLKHNQEVFNHTRDIKYLSERDEPIYQEIKKIWESF